MTHYRLKITNRTTHKEIYQDTCQSLQSAAALTADILNIPAADIKLRAFQTQYGYADYYHINNESLRAVIVPLN